MAKLIYSAIASLDGYIEDEHGKFDWAEPDEEVHAFVNELERPVGTYLYGRRMYETMVVLGDRSRVAGQPSVLRDFAELWRGGRQGRLLDDARVRVDARERGSSGSFDPDAVRQLKAAAARRSRRRRPGSRRRRPSQPASSTSCHLFLAPVIVGGRQAEPSPTASACGSSCDDERRFESGVVYLSYRVV